MGCQRLRYKPDVETAVTYTRVGTSSLIAGALVLDATSFPPAAKRARKVGEAR